MEEPKTMLMMAAKLGEIAEFQRATLTQMMMPMWTAQGPTVMMLQTALAAELLLEQAMVMM